MGIEVKDVLALIPPALEGAKALAGLFSPKAAQAIGFGGELAAFIIDAEARGLSAEAVVEGVSDLSVTLIKKLKFGV
jgi:hypothetical protein